MAGLIALSASGVSHAVPMPLDAGLVVWLKADAATIKNRLAVDSSRPPLTGSDTVDEVSEVLHERLPAYRRAAHISIDTTNLSPAQIADSILKQMPDLGRGGYI